MNMKVVIAVALLFGLGFAMVSFLPEAAKPIKVGELVLPVSLPDLQGDLQTLPQDKVYLLNFWATWCPPCRKEVPSMVKLYDAFKDRGFEIVAISVDKSKSDVEKFVAEQKMNFKVLWDKDSSVAQQYGVFRYPETFIVDAHGKVLQHLKGGVEWLEPEYYNYIDKLLPPLANK